VTLVDDFIHRYGRLPTEFDPDYLEMLCMSKYRIVDVPDFKPGKCANCGASKNDGRKYIDFGLEVDWHGIVYLCGLCLKDIATQMGLFEGVLAELKATYLNLQRFEDLKTQGVDIYEAVVKMGEEIRDFYSRVYPAVPGDSSDDSASVEPESTEPSQLSVDKAKPRTTKSSNGSGSENFRSLTDLLNDSRD
jgi:hypothetical protein